MPQRFLRPEIRTSERWNETSFGAQSLYIGLLTLVDDFGRYDGRPKLLRGEVFALRDDVKAQQTAGWLGELDRNDLIQIYAVEGKTYIQITRWKERARSENSKFPDPPQRNPAECCGILPPSSSSSSSPSPSPYKPFAAANCKKEWDPSEEQLRLGAIFRKRPSYRWSADQMKAWKAITPIDLEELEVVERYHKAKFPSTEKDIRRTSLLTLLRHFDQEVDKARRFKPSTVL